MLSNIKKEKEEKKLDKETNKTQYNDDWVNDTSDEDVFKDENW